MQYTVILPNIGMTMEEATVVRYCVQPGGMFRAGDPLYEIETEKVANEVEAMCDGVMVAHCVAEGDIVPVGGAVCIIDTPD